MMVCRFTCGLIKGWPTAPSLLLSFSVTGKLNPSTVETLTVGRTPFPGFVSSTYSKRNGLLGGSAGWVPNGNDGWVCPLGTTKKYTRAPTMDWDESNRI